MFVWIRDYEPAFIVRDVVAGLTIGLMLIPQSLAYAELAGLVLGFYWFIFFFLLKISFSFLVRLLLFFYKFILNLVKSKSNKQTAKKVF